MRSSLRLAFLVLVASCIVSPVALAQTLEEEQASADTGTTGTTGSAEATTTTTTTTTTASSDGATPRTVDSGHVLSDDQAAMEEEHPVPVGDDGISAVADETNHDYFAFGFLARGVLVPDFMINAFVTYRGGNPVNAGMGGFFSWRRNGLNFTAEVWYAGFGNNGFYHGNGAADTETEFVRSDLGVVFGNVVFQWAVPVTPWFSLDLGLGIGLGGVVGNIYRQEAYPDTTNPYGYSMCQGVGAPNGAYCEGPQEMVGSQGRLDDSRRRGGTYQIQNGPSGTGGSGPNPFYFGDGGIPPMMAWLDLPRVTARFTPIRFLQIRLDLAYNIYGFSFGGGLGVQL